MKGSTSHMPSRNVVKEFTPESFYHVYNRGVEKRRIFLDDNDYTVFLGLLKKYLTGESDNRNNRHAFVNFAAKVELLAYCLLPTHFHLLFYQVEQDAISRLMRRISTGYVMYFNDRYKRVGSLFQGTYKASPITEDVYIQHISRYIHLNPDNYKSWPYSSLQCYRGSKKTKWVRPAKILNLFSSRDEYLEFVDDYEANQRELDLLKWQLANGSELM